MALTAAAVTGQERVPVLEDCKHSVAHSVVPASELNPSEAGAPHLAVPRRGHVLSTVVETYGSPIREAVAILSRSFPRQQSADVRADLLSPRMERPTPDFARSDEELAAWAVVSMWVVGVAVNSLATSASLSEAETWFSGTEALTALLSDHARTRAEAALTAHADAQAYLQLLPYVLDPHGPGSRLSVRRDPQTHAARSRKRAEGVFYTPADVATYMASACLSAARGPISPRVFDPACGTGVFLRAALQEIQRRDSATDAFSLAAACLFGADIDPWPLDATAFVLLADSWPALRSSGRPPVAAWRRLRMNLACVDTLRIDPAESSIQAESPRKGRISISRLFPPIGRGPTVVLGNPPYAHLGPRPDLRELRCVYETLAIKPHHNAAIYLPFVEQMIRLAHSTVCSGALVLPLSVACNLGAQFTVARDLISRTLGRWQFAFFDREPHALFGEDVKTRNAIVLWSRRPSDTKPMLSTGPLRKWRGDSRSAMFRSLRFTAIDGDIRTGVPKISGERQAEALRALSAPSGRLAQLTRSISRIELAKTADADNRTVFVGATAYNFLNVFLKPPTGVLRGVRALSAHPLHGVTCASRADAFAVFGILSSHLAYWWWHTHGDGFHVSRRFITELPVGVAALSERVADRLSEHGAALWTAIKAQPIMSLNRGRTSLAYTPNGHDGIRHKLDEILVERLALAPDFVDDLRRFTARTVAATLHPAPRTDTVEEDHA